MNSGGFSIEPVVQHRDARGSVVEPIAIEALRAQGNAHLVLTEPGCVRGNHYHPRGAEVSLIIGPALVRVQLEDGIKDIHVPDGEAYRFYFPPGLPHAAQNTGTRTSVMVAFNTEPYDRANPDVVAHVLIQ